MTDILYTTHVDLDLLHVNLFHDKCLNIARASLCPQETQVLLAALGQFAQRPKNLKENTHSKDMLNLRHPKW